MITWTVISSAQCAPLHLKLGVLALSAAATVAVDAGSE